MAEKVSAIRLRSFGLTVGGVFAAIGLLPILFGNRPLRAWAVVLSVLLMLAALVFPRSLSLVYQGWMAVGHVLGWINTRLILSAIFYLLFTPMGLVMRLLSKDLLHRCLEPGVGTYRVRRQPRLPSHMKRQF